MEFGELVDEAAEQAGLDPAALTHRHLNSMSRSLMLLFTTIENKGAHAEYRMSTDTYSLPIGQGGIVLPADTIDVTEVALRSPSGGSSFDINLSRTHRDDFLSYSRKDQTGRPHMYWVSKSLGAEAALLGPDVVGVPATAKLLIIRPFNDQANVSVIVNRVREIAQPSNLASVIDARRNWLDTICTGLAARTAQKFNYERFSDLNAMFEGKVKSREQDEDRHPVFVGFRAHGFSRRRRH